MGAHSSETTSTAKKTGGGCDDASQAAMSDENTPQPDYGDAPDASEPWWRAALIALGFTSLLWSSGPDLALETLMRPDDDDAD